MWFLGHMFADSYATLAPVAGRIISGTCVADVLWFGIGQAWGFFIPEDA